MLALLSLPEAEEEVEEEEAGGVEVATLRCMRTSSDCGSPSWLITSDGDRSFEGTVGSDGDDSDGDDMPRRGLACEGWEVGEGVGFCLNWKRCDVSVGGVAAVVGAVGLRCRLAGGWRGESDVRNPALPGDDGTCCEAAEGACEGDSMGVVVAPVVDGDDDARCCACAAIMACTCCW